MEHQTTWVNASSGDLVWVSDPKGGYVEGSIVSISGSKKDKLCIDLEDGDRLDIDCALVVTRGT